VSYESFARSPGLGGIADGWSVLKEGLLTKAI
jgi:hypothetical protein